MPPANHNPPPGGSGASPPGEPKELTLLAETSDEWEEAVEEWGEKLHLGDEQATADGAEPALDNAARLRLPGGGQAPSTQALRAGDLGELPTPPPEEFEALPPLPPLPEPALPDFQPGPSLPPTVIADLGQVLHLEADSADEELTDEADQIEAELPPAPPSSLSQPRPSRQTPQPAAPVPVPVENSAPPLPPPPAQSAASPVPGPEPVLETPDEVAQLPPMPLPPEPAPDELDLGLLPPEPQLPVDDEFYDAIAIEKPERPAGGIDPGRPVRWSFQGAELRPPLEEPWAGPTGPGGVSARPTPGGAGEPQARFGQEPSPAQRPLPAPADLPAEIMIEADLPPGSESAITPRVTLAEILPSGSDRPALSAERQAEGTPAMAATPAQATPAAAAPVEPAAQVAGEPAVSAPAEPAASVPTEPETAGPPALPPAEPVPAAPALAPVLALPALEGAPAEAGPAPPALPPEPAAAAPRPPGHEPSQPSFSVIAALSRTALPASSGATPAGGLVARRLPLPDLSRLPPPVAPAGGSRPVTAEERRQLLGLLDAEARVRDDGDPQKTALAVAAARQAELLGEAGDAQDRCRAALELESTCRPALRGLRRLLSQPGPASQPDEALTLLERELEQAPPDRAALVLQRSELLLLLGETAAARAALRESVGADADVALSVAALGGLRDAALRDGAAGAADAAAASGTLAELPPLAQRPLLRAALRIEQARFLELGGRDAEAAASFTAALAAAPTEVVGLPAGLGLLRTALRHPPAERPPLLRRAQQALADALSPGPLRAALQRRAALLADTAAERAEELRRASEGGDRLVLEDLGLALELAGQPGEDAACYAGIAERSSDPARRADALLRAGEALERAGRLDEARAALLEALRSAEEAGVAYDAVAERALERVDRAAGRPEDLLALARREAERRTGAFAPAAHLQAARALLAQGKRDEAIAELRDALAQRPDFGPAVLLLRQLLGEAGRYEEAAAVLRAAVATEPTTARGDAALRLFYREDAARLLGRAGRPIEGAQLLAAELPQAEQPATARALRWQALRLLGPRIELVPETEPQLATLLADIMRADAEEAEAGGDRQGAADLWFRRALLLGPVHPQLTTEGSPVEESLARALALEPAHGPALVALCERVLGAEPDAPVGRSRAAQLALAQFRERLLSATGRPEAVVLLLRLGALQEHEAQDARGALLTLNLLRSVAPAHPGAGDMEEGLLHLARRAGDPRRTLELLEDELSREQDEELRFALLIQIGELYESLGQLGPAAARFEQALELRRGQPVARSALWRVYQAAGEFGKLRSLADAELREAVDFAGRVAACERLAALATLDPELAREPHHAIEAYRELLTVDANHHLAMRVLERHFIAEQNWGDLIHLYEQMGLTATDTAFAVYIHLERAHLRQKLAWQSSEAEPPAELSNELENDYRLALYRDRHSRPALRYILATALRSEDLNQVADISLRLAEVCDQSGSGRGEAGDGRAAAVFLTRAAECYAALGQPTELVVQTYREALGRNARHVPAARGLLHFALQTQQWADALDAAELCAEALHDPALRYHYHLLAGAVAQEHVGDPTRALLNFREALRLDPTREGAFERMRAILMGQAGMPANPLALADLITEQLQLENDPQRQVALRLDLAALLQSELNNRARAKVELRQALSYDPQSAPVLEQLANLHFEDGDWLEAVDMLVRRARVERRPEELAEIFLRLGQIYSEHLPDPRRAAAAYSKVLDLQPHHVPALTQLSALHVGQQRPEAAVPLLERLAELVQEREQKVAYLHRAARILESSGDLRGAQHLLQRAVDVDPMYLTAVGALAQLFDRQSDVQSMRVHLDRAAARWRQLLRESPFDATVYQALVQIFQWRRATDLAVQAASAVQALGGQLPADAQGLLERDKRADGYPGEALRDPQLDELLFPAAIPPGFRALFQLVHEPLGKLYRTDFKRLEQLGVSKRERLPRSGHPVRDLANRIAADLGAGDFDIYATAAQGRDQAGRPVPLCTLEATDPPALVLSQPLLVGASEAELRFVLGRLLKLVQARMVLPFALPPDDLGLLLGGLVRLFVKDYVPIGYPEKRVDAEAQRLHRQIPRRLEGQLLPLAMECSSAALDAAVIREALLPVSNHAGLLIAGSVTPAVAALRRLGAAADPQLAELLQFAVSMEYEELRKLVGTSIG